MEGMCACARACTCMHMCSGSASLENGTSICQDCHLHVSHSQNEHQHYENWTFPVLGKLKPVSLEEHLTGQFNMVEDGSQNASLSLYELKALQLQAECE